LRRYTTEERRLFADRIHYLDRRITPGLHKLNWTAAKNVLEYFIKEARKYCQEVYDMVLEYKVGRCRLNPVEDRFERDWFHCLKLTSDERAV
jgi:dynein heavy chain